MKQKITGYLTIPQLAKLLGVSQARTHVLIRTYGVEVLRVNKRMLLVPNAEVGKIPSREKRRKLTGKSLNNRS